MNSEAFLEFEDFLKLHSFKFDFQFAFKSYDPWKFFAIPTKDACSENATPQAEHCNSSSHSVNAPSGGSIKQMVLKSAALEHTIRSLKLESGESEQQLRKRAAEILDLMGHNQTVSWARIIGGAVYCIIKRTFDNIYVNARSFQQIQELLKKGPVVFLPSHRSYMDFLLVSIVLFAHDMPIPVIAAAIDFLGMKFVGELLRRCGAFFIRRSFKTDKLYWTIFYEYVQAHLHAARFPIEFFIEGTRSRTGNFLYPKSGMLNVVCQDFFKGRVTDVYFVPVSISYERLFEETLYAFELATGLPKPKESTSAMLKARKVLDESFGNIYINFGQPFSLREAAYGRVDRSVFSCTPIFEQFVSPQSESFVQELSLYAIGRIQENLYIQPWHLISSVLLNYAFSSRSRAVPAMLLVEKLNLLAQILTTASCKQVMTSYSLSDVIKALQCHVKTVHFCAFSKMFLLAPEELNFNKEGKVVPIIPVQLLMYQNMFVNHLAPLFIALKIIEKRNGFISFWEFEQKLAKALDIFCQEFVAVEGNANFVLKMLESLKVIHWNNASEIDLHSLENSEIQDVLNKISRPYFTVLCLTMINIEMYAEISEKTGKYISLSALNSLVRSKISQCYDSGKLSGACAVTTTAVNNVFNLCKMRGVMKIRPVAGASPVVQIEKHKLSELMDEIRQLFPCDHLLFAITSIKSKL